MNRSTADPGYYFRENLRRRKRRALTRLAVLPVLLAGLRLTQPR